MSEQLVSGLIASIISLIGVVVAVIIARMNSLAAIRNEIISHDLRREDEQSERLRQYIESVEKVRISLWSIYYASKLNEDQAQRDTDAILDSSAKYIELYTELAERRDGMREAWAKVRLDADKHPATEAYRSYQHKCLNRIHAIESFLAHNTKQAQPQDAEILQEKISETLIMLERLQANCLSVYVLNSHKYKQ